NFGGFIAGYDGRLVLKGGTLDLRDDGTVRLRELDARWDKLDFTLGVTMPEVCFGGGFVDLPFGTVHLPGIDVFSGDPSVSVTVDLAPLVKHELSLVASPLIQHFDPATTAIGKRCQQLHTALDIDDTKPQWRVFCDPQTIDLDPFDFADTVGDLFEQALTDAVDALLPHGPLHDLILAAIGSVADLLRTLLDIPDDISEWLSDLFNVSFGVFNPILQFVAGFFGTCVSFFQLDDPYPMFPKTSELAEVMVPIQHLTATVSDVELVVTADIGAVS
ncbi:MAG TPA: hypothetical protein VK584_12135, partial [Streptosporangiaceae bacterium]|nr:hypothetical protein [Streptosporangiaceae bacterium]